MAAHQHLLATLIAPDTKCSPAVPTIHLPTLYPLLTHPLPTSHPHVPPPVLALSLSPDALTLVSGGQEAVLVLWRLAAAEGAAGKTFLPRLGGAVLQISNTW